MADIRLARLTDVALRDHLDDLARLRMTVFRDFPYLYDGSVAYEARYLQTYAEAADCVIVGAFDGNGLVGAATALPFAHEPPDLTRPFLEFGLNIERIFYFGELVLLPGYRGRGIGVAFFQQLEAITRSFERFTHICFCTVIRPDDHPRRPPGFVPLDGFWRRRGCAPLPGLIGHIAWKDLDEPEQTAKPMAFWMKALLA